MKVTREALAEKAQKLMGNSVPETDSKGEIKRRIRFFLRRTAVATLHKGQCQKQPVCTTRTRNGKPLKGRYDHAGRLKATA